MTRLRTPSRSRDSATHDAPICNLNSATLRSPPALLLQAVPLRFGSFPRAPMAAEIRYGVVRESGVRTPHSSIDSNAMANPGRSATDGGANGGTAMDADAPSRLQCIVETPPNSPSVFVFGFESHGLVCTRICMQAILKRIRSQ